MLACLGTTTTALAISIHLRGCADREAVKAYLERRCAQPGADVHLSVFLVQVLCWEGRTEEAESIVHTAIRRHSSFTYGQFVQRIGDAAPELRILRTRYVSYPNSTMQNMGFFEHDAEERSSGRRIILITKLTTTAYSGTEPLFLQGILPSRPALQGITPRSIDVFLPEGSPLCFLTTVKVPGNEALVQDMDDAELDRFMGRYRAIAEVPFAEVAPLLPPPVFEVAYSHAYLVSALQSSHDPGSMLRLEAWLRRSVEERDYAPVIRHHVHRSLDALRAHAFFDRVDPGTHYGLLHGDLHRYNVLCDGPDHWIIDWGKCATGPQGIDLAVLFRRLPFERTVAMLRRSGSWEAWPMENRVLLAYALIVVSVMIDLPAIKNEPPEQLFAPAADLIVGALERSRS